MTPSSRKPLVSHGHMFRFCTSPPARPCQDEGKVLEHFETLALAIGADFDLVNLGRLTPCEQAGDLDRCAALSGVGGLENVLGYRS